MATLPGPRLRILLLGAVLLPTGLGGQEPLPLLDEYHVRAYTVADGLAASDIRVIAQDPTGYLYAGGGRGVARFDGRSFTPLALDGFETKLLDRMARDAQGRVWMVSRADDVGYIEDGGFRALPAAPVALSAMTHTSDGLTWFGSQGGIVRVDPDAAQPWTVFTTRDGLPSDRTSGVHELASGERLVLTEGGLAHLVPDSGARGGLRFEPLPLPLPETALFAGHVHRSALWISVRNGMLRYQDDRIEELRRPDGRVLRAEELDWPRGQSVLLAWPSYRVDFGDALPGDGRLRPQMILGARDGTRWISTMDSRSLNSELVREREGRFELVDLRSHMDFRRINRMFEDHEGGIWLGTDRGLFQISPRRVASLTARHGLQEVFTTAVLQTRDHSLWVGAFGGGLHRFSQGRLAATYEPGEGGSLLHVRSLLEASDGTLWIGARGGISAIGPDGIPRRIHPAGEVRDFLEVREADGGVALWAAEEGRVLVGRPPPGGTAGPSAWRFRELRPQVSAGVIWFLHQSADGTVWVGGEDGLFRLVEGSVSKVDVEGGPAAGFVSVHEVSDGTLWFGSYDDGLFRYRDGRFARLTTAEGLLHDGVWSMLEDGLGGVWMSSDAGVFRVALSRLHEVADAVEAGERPRRLLSPLVFTEAEGLPSRECNRASPAGWRLRDGRLVFNNLAGVIVIDPERAIQVPPTPPTVLQAAAADGRPVQLGTGNPLRLPPGTRHVDFEFAALTFATPEQNRYRYRLEGYDEGWVRAFDRRASYAGLPPGHYTFQVQGATGMGDWSEAAAAQAFVLPPFFWQTWWFRLLVLAAVGALLAAAYRYRVARLLEMERMRVRIASDLHDDVGSNLSSIALLSEMLRARNGVDGLERRQLERISRAAGETIDALREIIWLVDPKHDNASDLVRRMRATASALLNGTASEFAVSEPLPARRLEPLLVRQIFLIYKEALHNVVKHARARRVRTEVGVEDGRFRLTVADDGRGFAEAGVAVGQGLESMRRRAREAGGEIDVDSGPGRGTRVTFTVDMA